MFQVPKGFIFKMRKLQPHKLDAAAAAKVANHLGASALSVKKLQKLRKQLPKHFRAFSVVQKLLQWGQCDALEGSSFSWDGFRTVPGVAHPRTHHSHRPHLLPAISSLSR